jgi:hypothetical protein
VVVVVVVVVDGDEELARQTSRAQEESGNVLRQWCANSKQA